LKDEARRAAELLRGLGITELVDIGGTCPIDHRAFGTIGIAVRRLGYLAAEEVSRELLQCRIGFLDYPLRAAAKSSVFAAYAAHGVAPIFRNGDGGTADRITIREQALALSAATHAPPSGAELQHLCDATRAWYWACSSANHANEFMRLATGRIAGDAQRKLDIETIGTL
jgi:hypothetical protein